MVRSEIVNKVSSELGITKKDAAVAVNTVFANITEALARGDKVELRGFGSFTIRKRKPRLGRNPKTGEVVHVPDKKIPFFRAGRDLKIVS